MPDEQEFSQRFLSDESFRQEFKNDPVAVMRAHGVDVPDGVEIEVVESTPHKHYVVMPPLQSDELSEGDLDAVQGGAISYLMGCPWG